MPSSTDGGDEKEGKPSTSQESDLRVDAVTDGNVLDFLNAPLSAEEAQRPPASALGSDAVKEANAQAMQQRFQETRTHLLKLLTNVSGYVNKLRELNGQSALEVPPKERMAVLHTDAKLGGGSSVSALPEILDCRLEQVEKHVSKLEQRLNDSRSRVLVTGDLNAGKSSLCNRLLRRRVLPTDQMPCTSVFCEVVDAHKNGGVEEVHALPLHGNNGNSDEVEKFPLSALDKLVLEAEKYRLLVVYVKDPRDPQHSLLANGVVDICLIDAPGLNVSEVTTTELFGRQEEIDLVIFVVTAENQFTQSACEFVSDAAREKALLFVAVNNFDKIRDKDRCRNSVLNQLSTLAPETYKGANDFVHFGSFNGDPSEDPNDDPNNGNNDGNGNIDAFEASLRNFILEKRSAAKLAPARTYTINVLGDIVALSRLNRQRFQSEQEEVGSELQQLMPEIADGFGEYASVCDKIDKDIELLTEDMQHETEQKLNLVVSQVGEQPAAEWEGIANTFTYAQRTRDALVERVLSAVEQCEEDAREITANAVAGIKQLGVLHVGDQPAFAKVFNRSAMFSRKRDNLSKRIHAQFGFSDMLFDFGALLERPLPVLLASKSALAASQSSATATLVTTVGVVASAAPLSTWLRPLAPIAGVLQQIDVRKLAVPVLAVGALAFVAYTVHELPQSIPKRLARKIAFELDDMGYVRSNAARIAAEARWVLRLPAQDVRQAFQQQLETRTRRRDELTRRAEQAEFMLSALTEIEEGCVHDVGKARELRL